MVDNLRDRADDQLDNAIDRGKDEFGRRAGSVGDATDMSNRDFMGSADDADSGGDDGGGLLDKVKDAITGDSGDRADR